MKKKKRTNITGDPKSEKWEYTDAFFAFKSHILLWKSPFSSSFCPSLSRYHTFLSARSLNYRELCGCYSWLGWHWNLWLTVSEWSDVAAVDLLWRTCLFIRRQSLPSLQQKQTDNRVHACTLSPSSHVKHKRTCRASDAHTHTHSLGSLLMSEYTLVGYERWRETASDNLNLTETSNTELHLISLLHLLWTLSQHQRACAHFILR